jgi:transposase
MALSPQAPSAAAPAADGADDTPAGDDTAPAGPPELTAIGLVVGDRVRWRDRPNSRPKEGTVTGRERDGSVAVRDGRGASRALRLERLEVAARGPRGGATWESVAERAARHEQMPLWQAGPARPGRPLPSHADAGRR